MPADLASLERIVRAKPQQRELCCPGCGGDVELDGLIGDRLPRYRCTACTWNATTLAALAVRLVPRA
jgi:predicted  nucleic acid-binding Zn ribbon protein